VKDDSTDRSEMLKKANELLAQGKRSMVVGEVPKAVNVFEEAVKMLVEQHGEMSADCAEAYFQCGSALLELSRMENSVLGGALDGVEVEEEKEVKESDQFEKAPEDDDIEREELRVKVYDAMSEEQREKANGEKLVGSKGDEKMETEEKDEKPKTEEKDEKPTETKENKTEKTETKEIEMKDKNLTEKEGEKDKTEEVEDRKKAEDEKTKMNGSDNAKETDTKENGKVQEIEEMDADKPAKKTDEKGQNVEETCADKKAEKTEEKERKIEEMDADKQAENTDKKEPKPETKEQTNGKTDMETDMKDTHTKMNGTKDTEKEGEDKDAEDKETEETEEGDEENEDAEDGEDAEEKEEEEEVSHFQLAWEYLDLAKVIYSKKEEKEAQLKAADCLIKLGEHSMETENAETAITDLESALEIQKKHLASDNRILAETYYQLGLACSLGRDFEKAVTQMEAAITVLEARIASLKKLIEEQEVNAENKENSETDELKNYKDEIKEIQEVIPEMRNKIEDFRVEQKDADKLKEAAKEMLGLGSTSKGFGSPTKKTGETNGTTAENGEKKASDISSLVRKKRKPEDEAPVTAQELKKIRQSSTGDAEVNGVNGVNGHSEDPSAAGDAPMTNGHVNGDASPDKKKSESNSAPVAEPMAS